MGIKNLHNFLRKMCPNVYSKVPILKYAFKKIAIDTSIFMCKYKNTNGNNYIDSFLNLISVLRYNEIHFVFVYDTKAPPEKDNERKNRIEAREKNKLRIQNLKTLWEDYKKKYNENEFLIEKANCSFEDENLANFILKIFDNDDTIEKISSLKVDIEINKLQNSLLAIRTEDFKLTKEFFKACNIPILDADGEAEATCSELVKQGFITAVLTEDTDVLAYGTPIMLHKLDLNNETVIEIDYEEILNSLKITSEQFLDFCILCGTDYNHNIPKIGPDKAYKLIKSCGNLDSIKEKHPHLPFEILNYEKVRSLFNKKLNFAQCKIPYCGFPDKFLLENLYFINNCKYDLEKLYKSFNFSIFHDFEFKTVEEKKKKNLLLNNKI